jgi:hypothetical protein
VLFLLKRGFAEALGSAIKVRKGKIRGINYLTHHALTERKHFLEPSQPLILLFVAFDSTLPMDKLKKGKVGFLCVFVGCLPFSEDEYDCDCSYDYCHDHAD